LTGLAPHKNKFYTKLKIFSLVWGSPQGGAAAVRRKNKYTKTQFYILKKICFGMGFPARRGGGSPP
jgi:hypothetical protein